MSYRDKCEELYVENQELKERLKEADQVIEGLSKYYDLYSEAWSAHEYQFLLDTRQYLERYKGDNNE